MAVSQRGSSWQAYVRVDGQRIRKSFSTKEDATVWEALARQAITHGKPVPNMGSNTTNNHTLSKAADECYLMFWKGSKSDEKMVQYIKLLVSHFGTRFPINSFTNEVVGSYILDLKELGNSNATINRKLSCLSKILKYAHELGKLDKLPKIHKQKEGKNRIRWLTKGEEQSILDLLIDWGKYDIHDAVVVSLDTGVRHGELGRIQAKDIVPDGLYIGLTKNGEPRLVPLTKRARKVLEDRINLIRANQSNDQSLFPTFTRDWHRSTWERVRNHLELDDVVWHTFRHTTCSRLVQGGVPLTHVKEWMGHKTITTTMRYAHLAPKHLQEIVGVLE